MLKWLFSVVKHMQWLGLHVLYSKKQKAQKSGNIENFSNFETQ